MKLYLSILIVSLLYTPFVNGANNSLKQTNVNWNSVASWSLNRLPQNADTVTIPAGFTVIVSNNIYNANPNLYIKVYGIINFLPNGKLYLGENSTIEIFTNGKITSTNGGSGIIYFDDVLKYKGSIDGTITGYALANPQSPASGSGPGSAFLSGTLAVGLKDFQAVKMNGKVYVNWQTGYEKDADHFEVECSDDKTNWKTVYTIKAFNQATGDSYNYINSDPVTKDIYFRLKSVQKDGSASYSSVSLIKRDNLKSVITIYPNPTSDYALVSFNTSFKKGIITLSSFEGQVVQSKSVNSSAGYVKLEMATLPKGVYILEIKDQNQTIQTDKIILRNP